MYSFSQWENEFKKENFGAIVSITTNTVINQQFFQVLETAVAQNDVDLCNTVEGFDTSYPVTKEDAVELCKAKYFGRKKDIQYCLDFEKFSNSQRICVDEYIYNARNIADCEAIPADLFFIYDVPKAQQDCFTHLQNNNLIENTN